MSDYEVGNCKPPKEHQFKPGQSGNPGGKTSAHRRAEIEAAELAAKTRLKLVGAFANLVNGKADDAEMYELLNSDALRLLKESEDRGYGMPKASIDNTSSDGSMSPVNVSGDVLDAIRRKHAPDSD